MNWTQQHPLRTIREQRNLSQQDLADATCLSKRTIQRAEQGYNLQPESRQILCDYFEMSAEQLGLLPRCQSQGDGSYVEATLEAIDQLENEGVDMNRSRRAFFRLIGAMGVSYLAANETLPTSLASPVKASNTTIESLAIITQNFRGLQRAGLVVEPGLRDQIALIQNALENTLHEGYRRELWRLLAQSQLLARHSITNKAELGRARTYNEAAISSAQYSGDTLLFGAVLGHLGHLYLTWLNDTNGARQLLEQAQGHLKVHPVSGWISMVTASVAAKEGKKGECESAINRALENAYSLSQTSDLADLYYTDFNVVGTNAFAGNCLLKVGAPRQALERFQAIDLETLSKNRHASAYHDIACSYVAMGELEAAQPYAFQSIDCALATDRTYIIPRFIKLARQIQGQDPHEAHAASILEYAQHALSKGGAVA